MLDIVGWLKKLVVSFGGASDVKDVSGDTITEVLDELNTAVENGGGGGGGNNRFTATFTNNQGAWECDKTVSKILAAYQAGNACDCVIEMAQNIYGLGILADAVIADNAAVFSSVLATDDGTQVAVFKGVVDGASDVWTLIINDTVPAYDSTDIGKVLGLVDDGDGNPVLSWVAP